MPLPYHLVDGYNLLHAAGLAQATYGPGDLERARVALLGRIADGLSGAERERATVVFDAAEPPPNAIHGFRFRELTVLFAIETGEADAVIEELIRKHSAPRQLRVVSDDIRLQQAAKRRGARAVKSDAFLRRLARQRTSTVTGSTVTEHDLPLENWRAFFGLESDLLTVDDERPLGEPSPAPYVALDRDLPTEATKSCADSRPSLGDKTSQKRSPAESEPDLPAEDFNFWQQRIDEALAEERVQRPEQH
jgi:predicted RNA-binding protein with PIN domain